MAKLDIQVGSTSQTIDLFIQNNSVTTGAGLTGLVYNSSGLTAYYNFPGAGSNAISLATLAANNSAWSSGGFKEIDSTNEPGHYRFDIPNSLLASGNGRSVKIVFRGATNMADLPVEIQLTGWNNQDGVHGGMSALPNTACTSNASLITSGTGTDQLSVSGGRGKADVSYWNASAVATPSQSGVPITDPHYFNGGAVPTPNQTGVPIVDVKYSKGTLSAAAAGYFGPDWNAINAPTTTVDLSGTTIKNLDNNPPGMLTAAQIATGVWQDSTSGDFTVASSIGKSLYTSGVAPGGANGLTIAGTNAATSFASGSHFIGTVDTVTNLTNLPSIPNNWLTAAGIASGALNGKGDWLLASNYVTPPTAAQNATAVWTDSTSSDFANNGTPGKIVATQLGGSFTTNSSSVFSTAALANAPGGGPVTVGGYATDQDPATLVLGATASSWNAAGTIGQKINSAGAASDPMQNTGSTYTNPASLGYVIFHLGDGIVTVSAPPVNAALDFTIMQGDDYLVADSKQISFAVASPNLTNGQAYVTIQILPGPALQFPCLIVNAGLTNQTVELPLTHIQSASIPTGERKYQLVLIEASGAVTKQTGTITTIPKIV